MTLARAISGRSNRPRCPTGNAVLGHGPAPYQNPQRRNHGLDDRLLGGRRAAVDVHDVRGDIVGQERSRTLPQGFQNESGLLVAAEILGRLVTLAFRDGRGLDHF